LKKLFSILFFVWFVCIANSAFTQTDTIINGKKYTLVESKKDSTVKNKKRLPPLDSTFIYKDKKYKYYNNWLSGGAGIQQNFSIGKPPGFILGVDYNFHIKYNYYQLGLNFTGEEYGRYNNYQFHLGYGKRIENAKYQFAGFAGLSYSMGYHATEIDSVIHVRTYKQPGLYMQVEAIKKITYDVGVGAMLFADVNTEQTIAGAKIILFFAGS